MVLAVTVIVFSPAVWLPFVRWDDYEAILLNPMLRGGASRLPQIWKTPYMDLYVPATTTVWWVCARLTAQPNAHVFHALNVLLHLACAAVVFALLARVVRNPFAAAVGALVFAVHPVQVESVAWASGTKDVLSGLLVVLALERFLAHAEKRLIRNYILATACFVLAMLAKPSAVVTPLIALALARSCSASTMRRSAGWLLPWVVLTIPCLIWTRSIQTASRVADVPLHLRPLVALDAIAFYTLKILFPVKLAPDYGRAPAYIIAHREIWWTWLIPATVLAIALVFRARRMMTGLALFVIGLLPVLGLVRFDFQFLSTTADHYLYVPMVGVAVIAAAAATRVDRTVGRVIGQVGIIALATMSLLQLRHWRSTHDLLTHTLDVNPRSFAAANNLAIEAMEKGNAPAAIDYATRAVGINRTFGPAYITLATAQLRQGRVDDAIQTYRAGIGQAPADTDLLLNAAILLAQRNDVNAALKLAERAVRVAPERPQARKVLGYLLMAVNRPREALAQFEVVARLDPGDAQAKRAIVQLRGAPE